MRLKTVVSLHRQNRESASKEPNAIRAISSESGFERSSIRQNDKKEINKLKFNNLKLKKGN